MSRNSEYKMYWGDLHCHCNVSYGVGSPKTLLQRAKEHLDFCAITGHAFWPDMPKDSYEDIVDYHHQGFQRCAELWPSLEQLIKTHTVPGQFIPFLSYEWHSLEYGDHNVYYKAPFGPLTDGSDLDELEENLTRTGLQYLMIPHHIGYRQGFRGINWSCFDSRRSPLVKVFSLHGCGESDLAPYPMLHSMGPRHGRSTAEHGLRLGHRFGFIASTDHHGAFPGSFGAGRTGVWAVELTRDGLWEGLMSRRTCAVTGERIVPLLRVNQAWPGEVIPGGGSCDVAVSVQACDFIEYIEVLQNEQPVYRMFGEYPMDTTVQQVVEAKIRIEWGWTREFHPQPIEGELKVIDGELIDVEPYFQGSGIVSPQQADPATEETLQHQVLHWDKQGCAWRSASVRNTATRKVELQSLIVSLRVESKGGILLRVNGSCIEASMTELFRYSQAHYLGGWMSQAIKIHRAVPRSHWEIECATTSSAILPVDVYRLRVIQRNGQRAWSSPIWVDNAT